MLNKFFIIVTMVTSTPQLGTDLFAFDHAYESENCLLYTSPSPRDLARSRMPSSA